MADNPAPDSADKVIDTLDELHAVLINGRFADLSLLASQQEKATDLLMGTPVAPSPEKIATIRSKASRNRALLRAAMNGIASVQHDRHQRHSHSHRLQTYDSAGVRHDLPCAAPTAEMRR